jgi:hypothetical protein
MRKSWKLLDPRQDYIFKNSILRGIYETHFNCMIFFEIKLVSILILSKILL